jgi:hypothetical protein
MTEEATREDYYDKILSIIKDYLGPAADRFISRQIHLHIKKDPQDLQRSDIPMLAIRIRSGLLVLTRDETVVEEAFRRLVALGD